MTQKEIAEAFSDTSTEIGSVSIKRTDFFGKLFGKRTNTTLSVGIIPAGKVEQIGHILKSMTNFEGIANLSQADQINTLMSENITPIIKIIGLGCSGTREQSDPKVLTAIGYQWGTRQLYTAFIEVYRRLDLQPFFDILTLSKNLNLSLFQEEEPRGQG